MEEYAHNLSKKPEVMNFIKQHDKGLAKEMQKSAQEYSKRLERSKGYGLSIGGR